MLYDQIVNPSKLSRAEPKIGRKRDGIKPELCGEIIAIDVNVGRLDDVVAEEVSAVGAFAKYSWHCLRPLPDV
jgi:hypothetical protein